MKDLCTSKSLCSTLRERLGGQGPGIVHMAMLNLKAKVNSPNKDAYRYLVVYKKDKKDPGLILNFCPWCGKSILAYQGYDKNGNLLKEETCPKASTKSRPASKK